jgi:hypothetical protein
MHFTNVTRSIGTSQVHWDKLRLHAETPAMFVKCRNLSTTRPSGHRKTLERVRL